MWGSTNLSDSLSISTTLCDLNGFTRIVTQYTNIRVSFPVNGFGAIESWLCCALNRRLLIDGVSSLLADQLEADGDLDLAFDGHAIRSGRPELPALHGGQRGLV